MSAGLQPLINTPATVEIDSVGIASATRLAMCRAIEALGAQVDHLLIDAVDLPTLGTPQTSIIKGDSISQSIAAASILAKVTRDRIMREVAHQYPGYNFEANKGYPCPVHKAALQAWGPSAIHRRSWVFMDHLAWNGIHRIVLAADKQRYDGALRHGQA